MLMTVYYVDAATGNNSNDGLTEGNAWETTSKVNSTLVAGDTALFRAGTYNTQILPANSGTSDGNRIIYKNYPSEEPVIKNISQDDTIYLINKNYITIDGFKIDGQAAGPNANFKHWLYMFDSDHNELLNCTLKRVDGWYGLRMEGTSSYNRFEGNDFDLCGEYDRALQDYGNLMDFKDDADHNLIKGNTFTHGGHDLLELQSAHNVIRDNIFDNDWADLEGAGKGNRSCSIKGKGSKLSRNLFENNLVKNTGVASDTQHPKLCKIQGTHIICRGNVFDRGVHIGIAARAPDGTDWVQDIRIHNNVVTDVGGPGWTTELGDNGLGVLNNKFFNNIIYDTRTNLKKESFDCDILIQSNNNTGVDGHTWRGTQVKGNSIVSQTPGDALINVKTIGIKTLAHMESNYPSNCADNIMVTPTFVSSNRSSTSDYLNDSGSSLIDAGVNLTTCDGGGTGTAVTVHDSLWFFDGWGVPTEVGDLVRVGSNSAVRITDVNYSTNVITLESSITWDNGDAFNLDHTGSAPNIGLDVVPTGADTTLPIITLLGDNPESVVVDTSWSEAGYTATDDVDGNITGSVVVAGDTVDIGTIGAYVITYNVDDSSANSAVQKNRTVNVVATPPGPTDMTAIEILMLAWVAGGDGKVRGNDPDGLLG